MPVTKVLIANRGEMRGPLHDPAKRGVGAERSGTGIAPRA